MLPQCARFGERTAAMCQMTWGGLQASQEKNKSSIHIFFGTIRRFVERRQDFKNYFLPHRKPVPWSEVNAALSWIRRGNKFIFSFWWSEIAAKQVVLESDKTFLRAYKDLGVDVSLQTLMKPMSSKLLEENVQHTPASRSEEIKREKTWLSFSPTSQQSAADATLNVCSHVWKQ